MPKESPSIKALKKAGQELKETEKTATSEKASKSKESSSRNYSPRTGTSASREALVSQPKGQTPEKEKMGLKEGRVESKILSQDWGDWQKEIINERQKLEKVYKEVGDLRRKIQQRLDRVKSLEANFLRVKNELNHFQQIKKENETLLEEIKNILKNQNEQ